MSETDENLITSIGHEQIDAGLVAADFARRLERERDEAREKLARIESLLLDPNAVFLNFLHGKIAKLDWAKLEHIHGPHPARVECDEAREAFVIATDQMVIAQGKVREANKERDEALNTNFEEISNKLVVAIRERDEARERAKELSELVDGSYILVELHKPDCEYNKKWRERWLEKAKRLIPGVDSIWY